MSKPTNRFKASVSVSLPHDQEVNLHRWFNLQNMGMELIPFKVKIPQKVKDAAYRLHHCRLVELEFEIDKKGNWKLVGTNPKIG